MPWPWPVGVEFYLLGMLVLRTFQPNNFNNMILITSPHYERLARIAADRLGSRFKVW